MNKHILFIKRKNVFFNKGFTLIELLIVMAIISVLSASTFYFIYPLVESARVSVAVEYQRELTQAVVFYLNDVGFYPPDVNRGWDPGLAKPLPWNPDIEAGDSVPSPYATSGVSCSDCPSNWQEIVNSRWAGPYISSWSRFTPWNGKYDYNYWPSTTTRSNCTVPPGVYIGVQGDYYSNNTIPTSSEQEMIDKGLDSDKCVNGESQMLLHLLP